MATRAPSLCCEASRGYARHLGTSYKHSFFFSNRRNTPQYAKNDRRRRKGKSQIWDNKIWSRVPRDSEPRMTALAIASNDCKRQTRPLVRERAPYQQTRKNIAVIKIWSYASGGRFIPRQTGRLTVGRNIRLEWERDSFTRESPFET
jgi:hypothetical protein